VGACAERIPSDLIGSGWRASREWLNAPCVDQMNGFFFIAVENTLRLDLIIFVMQK
jgi:hypothetical protein